MMGKFDHPSTTNIFFYPATCLAVACLIVCMLPISHAIDISKIVQNSEIRKIVVGQDELINENNNRFQDELNDVNSYINQNFRGALDIEAVEVLAGEGSAKIILYMKGNEYRNIVPSNDPDYYYEYSIKIIIDEDDYDQIDIKLGYNGEWVLDISSVSEDLEVEGNKIDYNYKKALPSVPFSVKVQTKAGYRLADTFEILFGEASSFTHKECQHNYCVDVPGFGYDKCSTQAHCASNTDHVVTDKQDDLNDDFDIPPDLEDEFPEITDEIRATLDIIDVAFNHLGSYSNVIIRLAGGSTGKLPEDYFYQYDLSFGPHYIGGIVALYSDSTVQCGDYCSNPTKQGNLITFTTTVPYSKNWGVKISSLITSANNGEDGGLQVAVGPFDSAEDYIPVQENRDYDHRYSSVVVPDDDCESKGGRLCNENEECNGNWLELSGLGNCCAGDCIDYTCEGRGGDICCGEDALCPGNYISASDSRCCCDQTCIPYDCATWGGLICEPPSLCPGYFIPANDTEYCCEKECLVLTCDELNGYACYSGDECFGHILPAADVELCCSEPCIKKACPDYKCSDNEYCPADHDFLHLSVKPGEGCCSVPCQLKSCADQHGYLCKNGEKCSTTIIDSSDNEACCSSYCERTGNREDSAFDRVVNWFKDFFSFSKEEPAESIKEKKHYKGTSGEDVIVDYPDDPYVDNSKKLKLPKFSATPTPTKSTIPEKTDATPKKYNYKIDSEKKAASYDSDPESGNNYEIKDSQTATSN